MDKNVLQPNLRFLRLPVVEQRTGRKKSKIYKDAAIGIFPSPVKVGRDSLWVEEEIDAWIRARIAERDGEGPALRLLVTERELAQALDISISWLQKDRIGSQTIPFVKVGQNVRYDLEEARQALKAMSKGGRRE